MNLWCKIWQFRAVNNLLFIVHGCGFQISKKTKKQKTHTKKTKITIIQDYWDQGYV